MVSTTVPRSPTIGQHQRREYARRIAVDRPCAPYYNVAPLRDSVWLASTVIVREDPYAERPDFPSHKIVAVPGTGQGHEEA